MSDHWILIRPLNQTAMPLLLGSFGLSLGVAFKEKEELEIPFFRLVVGFFMILFFEELTLTLLKLSHELADFCRSFGPKESLKQFVLGSLTQAGGFAAPQSPTSSSVRNLGQRTVDLSLQIFRTGVWGVASSMVEYLFLIASLILECAREVILNLIHIAFPFAAAFYPVFPGVLRNLGIFLIEVLLWFPLLVLIDAITSQVARQYTLKQESLGLYTLASEIVAIALILLTPSLAHKLVNGFLSSDLGASSVVISTIKKGLKIRL